jgi:hypothetical protein
VNYDGNVDFNDLVILAQRYNTTLATPVVAAAPVTQVSEAGVVAGVLAADSAVAKEDKAFFSTTPVSKPVAKKKAPVRPRHR